MKLQGKELMADNQPTSIQVGCIGDALGRSLVMALGADCGAAADVARTILSRNTGIVDFVRLKHITPAALSRVVNDYVQRRWLTAAGKVWSVGPELIPDGVPSFLDGAAAMRSSFSTDSLATAVVTLPPQPSVVTSVIPTLGMDHASLIETGDAFAMIAEAAVSRFTVMTPFINDDGLEIALQLFKRTRAGERTLIVRGANAVEALSRFRDEIESVNIKILDYKLPSNAGYETFHAKIVIADQDLAYVGSANMTVYARNSMELGIMTDNRAAKVIANVVRAVERVSTPINVRNLHFG